MQELDGVIYLRPSEINIYLDNCQAQYFFAAVEKVKVPNKLPLALGTATHRAFQKNFSEKVHTLKDLPVTDVMDAFSDAFEDELSSVDETDLKDTDKGKIKDNGLGLIKKYQKEVSPRIVPIAVEQRIRTTFSDPDNPEEIYKYGLTGQIDITDVNNIIVDHKTTSNPKTFKKDVNESYKKQVGGAYVILKESLGEEVKGVRVDMLKIDDVPGIRHINIDIDREHFLKMFFEASNGIDKGVFIPNRKSFLCTKRWCKFWNECEKRYGGIVKE